MRQPAFGPQTVTSPKINGERLLRRLREFRLIGRNAEKGGIERPGFSEADGEARKRLILEAREANLTTRVDAAGNILIGLPSTGTDRPPTLLIGSHLDTVANGGWLDGAYGVLAALEVIQVYAESGVRGPCEPLAVAFSNEEGALFHQPFFGSMALAGCLNDLPDEPADHRGRPLRRALARVGGDLDALTDAAWPVGSAAAYLELHIEQGPVLERSDRRVGVVTDITGRCILTVEVNGSGGHAGTTPMTGRLDAVAAAARLVLAVERLARDQRLCRVSTIGHFDTFPNSPNTIAKQVRLTVDLRDSDPAMLTMAEYATRDLMEVIARETGTEISVAKRVRTEPVGASPEMWAVIEESADELGLSHLRLPSGAGHDAQIISRIAPIGMIFVPSINGVSHCPEEDTAPDDLIAGAEVLLHTALRVPIGLKPNPGTGA